MVIALDDPTRTFLKLMQSVRKSLGLTQCQVADYVGEIPLSISRYENGERIPDLQTLIKLSVVLKCDISRSINYKVYYKKIKHWNVMKIIKKYDFTFSELAELTGYCERNIRRTLKSHYGYLTTNIPCLFAILKVLQDEKRSEWFREDLLSKKLRSVTHG